jgi:NTP pyrophosphatase (non-canonical NTP hydrolase)
MRDLESKIIKWATDRDLLPVTYNHQVKQYAQFAKSVEELSELGNAISKDDIEAAKDAIGDVIVTLVLQANTWGLDIHECVEYAYNQIKDRKGKKVGDVFVKECDLPTPDPDEARSI